MSNKKKILKNTPLYKVAGILLIAAWVIVSIKIYMLIGQLFPELLNGQTGISAEDFYWLRSERTVLLLVSFILILCIAWYYRSSKFAALVLIIAGFSFPLTFLEIGLMYYAKSDSVGLTFNHILYLRNFIIPYEHDFDVTTPGGTVKVQLRKNPFPDNFCRKSKIVFVGDSFTYGDGIEDVQNTFPEIFAAKDTIVDAINLGVRGIDPLEEYMVFQSYGREIDKKYGCNNLRRIVWQFCFNDVEPSAKAAGYTFDAGSNDLIEKSLGQIRNTSFFMNYTYWSLKRSFDSGSGQYKSFLRSAYADKKVVSKALEPIKLSARTLPVTVVVFPVLNTELAFSDTLYQELYAQLDSSHIQYLRVADIPGVRQMTIYERIVSPSNPHPSIQLCQMVGNALSRFIIY